MDLEGVESVPEHLMLIAPALARWSANQFHPGHPAGVFGASSLGSCAHSMGYRRQNVPPTNPMKESGLHATALGSLIHQAIQEELTKNPPVFFDRPAKVITEEEWTLRYGDHVEIESWADIRIDMEFEDHERPETEIVTVREVSDIKTTHPFGFKMKSTVDGPDRSHILQTSAGARALGAERCRLVLVATSELKGSDRIDRSGGENDFRENRYAEWVWPLEAADDVLDEELFRLEVIGRYLAEGREIPRHIPGSMPKGARIVDPATGEWHLWVNTDDGPSKLDAGTVWQCRYCDWQDLCASEVAE